MPYLRSLSLYLPSLSSCCQNSATNIPISCKMIPFLTSSYTSKHYNQTINDEHGPSDDFGDNPVCASTHWRFGGATPAQTPLSTKAGQAQVTVVGSYGYDHAVVPAPTTNGDLSLPGNVTWAVVFGGTVTSTLMVSAAICHVQAARP